MMQPNYSIEDDESCISADSSIHESDYASEDSSSGGLGPSRLVAATDDTSTISKTSLASMSLSSIKNDPDSRHSAIPEILSAVDTSSSSSGDDGWKTETSSASNVSSIEDNSSKYDEPRRQLQSRQKQRRTFSNLTGRCFDQPIDVENLKYQPNDQHMAAWITRQRLGFGENCSHSLSHTEASSVAHRIVGFTTALGRKHLLQGVDDCRSAMVPQEIPISPEGVDISANMACIPSYRNLVRLVSRCKDTTDIEKARERTATSHERTHGDRVANRSDFELFLIIVIAASLVTLVVLLGLLLRIE